MNLGDWVLRDLSGETMNRKRLYHAVHSGGDATYVEVFYGKLRCYTCGAIPPEEIIFAVELTGAHVPNYSSQEDEEESCWHDIWKAWREKEWPTLKAGE